VTGSLGSRTGGTGLAIVPDKESESGLGVFPEDQGLSLVLAPVTGSRVVVVGPEDSEAKVVRVQYVDSAVKPEEPFFIFGPTGVAFGGQLMAAASSEDGVSEFWAAQMSERSFSASKSTEARSTSFRRYVARRDAVSCFWVNTGWKLCALTAE
ncbi:hypothetical protein DICSQDRAFT_57476, partial [Dichomitus squalens LYAD-421 SS1]|uniref:uncharacterized protein n=1 Tax=Dichomitus squalens (strain LYAD-421) TaxID=732165 RepID=UPI0004413546